MFLSIELRDAAPAELQISAHAYANEKKRPPLRRAAGEFAEGGKRLRRAVGFGHVQTPTSDVSGPLRARHEAVDFFGRQVGADVAAEIRRGLV